MTSVAQEVVRLGHDTPGGFRLFTLYLYPNQPASNGYEDAEYWLSLEQQLQQMTGNKFTFTVNDDSVLGLGYRVVNSDK